MPTLNDFGEAAYQRVVQQATQMANNLGIQPEIIIQYLNDTAHFPQTLDELITWGNTPDKIYGVRRRQPNGTWTPLMPGPTPGTGGPNDPGFRHVINNAVDKLERFLDVDPSGNVWGGSWDPAYNKAHPNGSPPLGTPGAGPQWGGGNTIQWSPDGNQPASGGTIPWSPGAVSGEPAKGPGGQGLTNIGGTIPWMQRGAQAAFGDPQNYVGQEGEGWVAYVGGRRIGPFSTQQEAENAYNVNGGPPPGGSGSAPGAGGAGGPPAAGGAPAGGGGGGGGKTLEQMTAELRAAGYPGPWDEASVRGAYARTAVGGGGTGAGGAGGVGFNPSAASAANDAVLAFLAKRRLDELEIPELRLKTETELARMRRDDALAVWKQAYEKASLTGELDGKPTLDATKSAADIAKGVAETTGYTGSSAAGKGQAVLDAVAQLRGDPAYQALYQRAAAGDQAAATQLRQMEASRIAQVTGISLTQAAAAVTEMRTLSATGGGQGLNVASVDAVLDRVAPGRPTLQRETEMGRLDIDRLREQQRHAEAEAQAALDRERLGLDREVDTGRLGLDRERDLGRLALDREVETGRLGLDRDAEQNRTLTGVLTLLANLRGPENAFAYANTLANVPESVRQNIAQAMARLPVSPRNPAAAGVWNDVQAQTQAGQPPTIGGPRTAPTPGGADAGAAALPGGTVPGAPPAAAPFGSATPPGFFPSMTNTNPVAAGAPGQPSGMMGRLEVGAPAGTVDPSGQMGEPFTGMPGNAGVRYEQTPGPAMTTQRSAQAAPGFERMDPGDQPVLYRNAQAGAPAAPAAPFGGGTPPGFFPSMTNTNPVQPGTGMMRNPDLGATPLRMNPDGTVSHGPAGGMDRMPGDATGLGPLTRDPATGTVSHAPPGTPPPPTAYGPRTQPVGPAVAAGMQASQQWSPTQYNRTDPYAKKLQMAAYENAGEDPESVQWRYQNSLPRAYGPRTGKLRAA